MTEEAAVNEQVADQEIEDVESVAENGDAPAQEFADATINVKNATNEKYTVIDSYNQLERTIEVGLDYKF